MKLGPAIAEELELELESEVPTRVPLPTRERRGERRIVCSALRHRDSGDLILGPRHFDMTMHKQIANYKMLTTIWNRAEQGFIDNYGVFCNRKEAFLIAQAANQIIYRVGNDTDTLYSENLY